MCEIKTYPVGSVFYTAIGYLNFDKPIHMLTSEDIKSVLTTNAQSKTDSNWANSLYLSVGNDKVSRGYLIPIEDSATEKLSKNIVFIFKLTLKQKLQYIDCRIADYKNGVVGNGEVVGKELFEHIIKDSIDNDFMTKLGKKNLAFECYHDESGNRECIIPSNLITDYLRVISYQQFDINANGEIDKEHCIISLIS